MIPSKAQEARPAFHLPGSPKSTAGTLEGSWESPSYLIVELKSFHVHLGTWRLLQTFRLISRGDVKDHISETIKSRIQNRDPLPLTRATPLSHPVLPPTLPRQHCVTQTKASLVTAPSLFLLPILLLLNTPQPFSLAGPKRCFSLPGCFPSIPCPSGCLELCQTHAHCLCSLCLDTLSSPSS